MRVSLRLSGDAIADSSLKVATLSEKEFWIGRGEDCDWQLSDPTNRLSSRHCMLRLSGGRVLLTDFSSNGTAVGSPRNLMFREQPTPISGNTTIHLAAPHLDARIELMFEDDAPVTTEQDSLFWEVGDERRERTGVEQPLKKDLLDGAGEDWLKENTALVDEPDAADRWRREREAAPKPPQDQDDSFSDLFNTDEPDDPSSPKEVDPFADLADIGEREKTAQDQETVRPDAPEEPTPSLDDIPEEWPTEEMARLSERPERDARPAPPPDDDAQRRAIEALFAGLGIDPGDIATGGADGIDEETLLEIGRTYRQMADGLRQLLGARRKVKKAFRQPMTEIEIGTNPLKYALDADDAVESLLSPGKRGCLSGAIAASDANADLLDHQVALLEAVKIAFRVGIETFDPARIETKVQKRGVGALIQSMHKAELWNGFVSFYDEFASEADDRMCRVLARELDALHQSRSARRSSEDNEESGLL